jgi:MscS family membrane protein
MLDNVTQLSSQEIIIELTISTLLGALFLVTLGIAYRFIRNNLSSSMLSILQDGYEKLIQPYRFLLIIWGAFIILDLLMLLTVTPYWLEWLEISAGLAVVILGSWLGSQIFRKFFDNYLLNISLNQGHKVNSEILLISKWLSTAIIILVFVITFAQTHQINLLGLLASLGIGGLAIAFAAQKTLEQILGGIVIYWDRPFVVDDYIGLPDGTFGKVESIGLRSTKIRSSGKGTLVIVPNSALTQTNIENFTGAKKVISVIYLTFYRAIAQEERALIRQVILGSTSDIFGIDSRSTEVSFQLLNDSDNPNQVVTQAQINFFILGSSEVSMDLRQQLLEVANQNITKQLKDYGIAFDIDESMVNVDSPITI